MTVLTESLEKIAKEAEHGADEAAVRGAIKTAQELTKGKESSLLKELDAELATWQSKLSVILKEPAGKKGMAKHARFWAERLGNVNGIER
jgi:hypothetical protein